MSELDDFFEKMTPEEIKISNEFSEYMKKQHEEEIKKNNVIFNDIKEKLGDDYLEDVKECLRESYNWYNLKIVDKPTGQSQDDGYKSFNHIYVNQTTNGGYTGDEFAGTIYIPIYDGKYLESEYSM